MCGSSSLPDDGLNRPVEANWFKSGRYRGLLGEMPVVVCLSLGRRDVADGLQQSVVVEPGHPFEGREFQELLGLPEHPAMDQFSLIEPADRFGQGVIAVALAAHRRFDSGLSQALAVARTGFCVKAGLASRTDWKMVISASLDPQPAVLPRVLVCSRPAKPDHCGRAKQKLQAPRNAST